jgi:hypothetical protein
MNITLHVVSGDDDATVRGDQDLLLEAIANLVDNALKFTPAGGPVEFALVRDKNESIVRVSDSGPASGRMNGKQSRGASTVRTRAENLRIWPESELSLSDRQAARLSAHDSNRSQVAWPR